MTDLTIPRRRYDLARSMMGQAVTPTRNAGAGEGIARILSACFAAKGMRRAEDQERGLIEDLDRNRRMETQSLVDAYTGVTPGESARTGLDLPQKRDRDALMTAMMGSSNPNIQGAALSQAISAPKVETPKAPVMKEISVGQNEAGKPLFQKVTWTGTGWKKEGEAYTKGATTEINIGKEEARESVNEKKALQNYEQIKSNIDRALEETGFFTTGVSGVVLGVIPGTPAFKLKEYLKPIQAALAFDTLQAMRDASPTGGALGQVSERELDLLQSKVTSLNPGMGDEELRRSLLEIRVHYTKWQATNELSKSEYKDQFAGFGEMTEQGIEVLDGDGNIIGYYD